MKNLHLHTEQPQLEPRASGGTGMCKFDRDLV